MSDSKNSVVYIGLFLTAASREELLKAVPARHKNVYADHVTLIFRPTPEEVAACRIGLIKELEIIEEIFDDKGQAVRVMGIASRNQHPHITISTVEGTKPVYSNTLFGKMNDFRKLDRMRICGTIDTYPRQIVSL